MIDEDTGASFFGWIMLALLASGWLTHVITCITDDRWGMLLVGGLFFPIGIIHGWLIWLGIA